METKKRRVRRTPESYRKEVEEITNGEYSVLGEFESTVTKVLHVHSVCGYEWETTPSGFIHSGSRCPKCAGKIAVRRTPESYRKEVSEITNGEYSVPCRYVNAVTKIAHTHIECGLVWEVTPNNFITHNSRCPKCANSRPRKANDHFIAEVLVMVGGEYTFLESYVDARTPIQVTHNTCKNTYKIPPNSFLSGRRCPRCSIGSTGGVKMSDEEFKKRVYDLVGRDYIFQGKYEGSFTHLNIKHTSCGYSYKSTPSNFFRGSRCPNCSIGNRLSDEEFKKRVFDLVGEEYIFQEPYVSYMSRLEVKHVVCGHSYKSTPSNFLSNGSRCPNCVYSRGEKAVADVLDSLSIEYIREHSFKYLGRKRYDFFIPSLNIAIEYDGEQHFKAVDHFGGEETLKRTQESDALKNDFCEYMGIDLLRIPYWEFDNIDEIVTNFIDTVKLMRSISANSSEMVKCR